eukprot:SAG31_NODE_225_length_19846_cov_19.057983_2_plen_256_part_00
MPKSFGSYWKPASFSLQCNQGKGGASSVSETDAGAGGPPSVWTTIQHQPAGAVYNVIQRAERRMREAERWATESVAEARLESSWQARSLAQTKQALMEAEHRATETERRAQVSIADAWELATRQKIAWGDSVQHHDNSAGFSASGLSNATLLETTRRHESGQPQQVRQMKSYAMQLTDDTSVDMHFGEDGDDNADSSQRGGSVTSEIHRAATAGNLSCIVREIDRNGPDGETLISIKRFCHLQPVLLPQRRLMHA